MVKVSQIIFIVINLVFGGYLINFSIKFIKVPEFVSPYDPWILLVGGILIVFGAVNYLRVLSRKVER